MHKLKEKLMDALYEYEDRAARNVDGKISDGEIQKIHILTDTVKNIDKIEKLEGGDGYSGNTDFMGEGKIYGTSYARTPRRDSRGRYASYRYPYMDGYSREDGKAEMTRKLREMIGEASSEEERSAIRHCINAIEEM